MKYFSYFSNMLHSGKYRAGRRVLKPGEQGFFTECREQRLNNAAHFQHSQKTYVQFRDTVHEQAYSFLRFDPIIEQELSDCIAVQSYIIIGIFFLVALKTLPDQGNKKKYTYNDIRLYSNAIAQFLLDNGIKPEERICLFMDRIPELYISFLGVLKMGGIVQPLFSAFGEEALFTRLEDASTCAIFTTMKHIRKVRKILHKLPDLKYIFVVDAGNKKLEKFEISFNMEK